MSYSPQEIHLVEYVQGEINKGKTRIIIPQFMLNGVRKEIMDEVIRLCRLNGVEIEGIVF